MIVVVVICLVLITIALIYGRDTASGLLGFVFKLAMWLAVLVIGVIIFFVLTS